MYPVEIEEKYSPITALGITTAKGFWVYHLDGKPFTKKEYAAFKRKWNKTGKDVQEV